MPNANMPFRYSDIWVYDILAFGIWHFERNVFPLFQKQVKMFIGESALKLESIVFPQITAIYLQRRNLWDAFELADYGDYEFQ